MEDTCLLHVWHNSYNSRKHMYIDVYLYNVIKRSITVFHVEFYETVDEMKSSSVAVCVFFSLLVTSSLAVIPAVWSDYIATVCRAFEISPTLYQT